MRGMGYFFIFFFSSRRRHTRLQGDWSSDVCSSDLHAVLRVLRSHADSDVPDHRYLGRSEQDLRGVQVLPVHLARLARSEEHTSELQSPCNLVCRLLLEKKNSTARSLSGT